MGRTVIELVGPKGYIHGWIYVGPQAAGARVFHPGLGNGTVTSHDGQRATVKFDAGGKHTFPAANTHGKSKGKLVHRDSVKTAGKAPSAPKPAAKSAAAKAPAKAPAKAQAPKTAAPKPVAASQNYPRMTNQQAEKWGSSNWPATTPPLPRDQYDALRAYSGPSYMHINHYLRTGVPGIRAGVSAAELDKFVARLDKATKDHPTPSKAMVVHRGVGLDALGGQPDKLIGKTVHERGFLSTSVGGGLSDVFEEEQAHLEIKVPAGTPAFYMEGLSDSKGERELLLGRGLQYKILSAKRNASGQWQVQAEIVPGVKKLANRRAAVELAGKTRRQDVAVKTPAPERAAGRRKLAGQQQALPDGSFIVPNVDYLKRAIRSVGRAPASKRPALGALIRKRAKELKATNAPGVKGTWAFQGAGDQPAVELTGPGGWSHGWIRGKGVPENDFKPAPSMTKDELTRHLMNEHGGAPVPRSMRGTSRKAKGKAALVAHHEEMHRMLAAGSPLVNQGIGHSHGQHVSASLAGAHGKAIEMAGAMPRRMPKVRGAADVQMRRAGPGTITVQHKSTGMKVGTLAAKGRGWQGMHASGVKTPASGSQQGALAGLIAVHNRLAAGSKSPMAMVPAQQMGSAVAASSDAGKAVDLAGSLPVTSNASSSDGPRVTSMGSGKAVASSGPSGLSPYAQSVYKKLIGKGMKPAQAEALARRAAAMHEKAAPKASAA